MSVVLILTDNLQCASFGRGAVSQSVNSMHLPHQKQRRYEDRLMSNAVTVDWLAGFQLWTCVFCWKSRSFRQKARWKFVNISCCLLIFGYIRRFNDTRVLFNIIWVSEVMLTYFSVPFQNICCFSAMMNTWCRNSKITKIVLSFFRIWYFIKLLVIAKIR